jgi:hypothetical protein
LLDRSRRDNLEASHVIPLNSYYLVAKRAVTIGFRSKNLVAWNSGNELIQILRPLGLAPLICRFRRDHKANIAIIVDGADDLSVRHGAGLHAGPAQETVVGRSYRRSRCRRWSALVSKCIPN